MIIDFHTHTFPDKIAGKVAETLSDKSHSAYYSDFTIHGLSETMKKNGVDYSVNLPVMTSVAQVEKINRSMVQCREEYFSQGIITFGGMHPDYGDRNKIYEELKFLKEHGIPGIKLHPAYQNVDLDDERNMNILKAANDLDMIVVTHAGIDIGIPHRNFASVEMILHVIREVHPSKLVLAHMGGWAGWNDVQKELAGAPVWLDTAFSIGTIEPKKGHEQLLTAEPNMSIERFTELVRAHGADKVLFATDCPWADQKVYIDMITESDLSEQEKTAVFSGNALKLLTK